MATSTTNNGFSQQDLGSNVNRWGDPILNVQLQLIDDALDGFLVLNNPGASIVLTSTNDVTNQARNRVLRLTGTQAADTVITVPNRFHRYWVLNETTGGVFVVGLKTAAQVTPIICKRGAKTLVGCDASNCFQMAPGSLSDLSAATADIDMGNHRITNMADGSNPNHAATVGQVTAAMPVTNPLLQLLLQMVSV